MVRMFRVIARVIITSLLVASIAPSPSVCAVGTGTLRVNTVPSGARVYIASELFGTSGGDIRLPAGTFSYSLRLLKDGYKEWSKQVAIVPDQTTTVYAYLEPGTGTSVTRNENISPSSAFGTLKVYAIGGSSVSVDGELGAPADNSFGGETKGILQGNHLVKVLREGYKDWTKQVTIVPDQTTAVYGYLETGIGTSVTRNEIVSPTTAFGTLEVNAVVGSSVFVDDELGAVAGAKTVGLPQGTYSVKVTKEGYKVWKKQVSIVPNKTTAIYSYLEQGTGTSFTRNETISPTTALGTLEVNAVVGSNVFVDDEFGANAGSKTEGIPEGIHLIRVTKPGYKDWAKQVAIMTNKTTSVYAGQEPGSGQSPVQKGIIQPDVQYASLDVDSGISGVSIYVNGDYWGATDTAGHLTVKDLSPGTQTLKLTKDGYDEWVKTVKLDSGQQTNVFARLEPGSGSSSTRPETIVPGNTGALMLRNVPEASTVHINGEYSGQTSGSQYSASDYVVRAIPPGTYTVKITNYRYSDWTSQVTLAAGENKLVYVSMNLLLEVDFSADKTTALVGEEVRLSDLSQGNAQAWNWDFGDGNTSAERNPVHLYGRQGNYTIILTVSDALGNRTMKKDRYITIKPLPQAAFSISLSNVKAGETLFFKDRSTGSVNSWEWNFGDGTTSYEQNPLHSYMKGGLYTVSLTAKEAPGSSTSTKLVSIKYDLFSGVSLPLLLGLGVLAFGFMAACVMKSPETVNQK